MSNVLVVDDEKNVLTTLSIGLRRNRYSVRQAQSGPEALKIMEEDPCGIVVSDIRMSPMDGFSLAEQIRKKYPGVSIILMSAYERDEKHAEKEARLVCHRLTKPFDVSELVEILKNEEKKRKKGSILIFCNKMEVKEISSALNGSGCKLVISDNCADLESHLQNDVYDLFIVDSYMLDDTDWKILNVIEHYAPNKPMVLLARNHGQRTVYQVPDLALTVLDREMFLKDYSQCAKLLDQVIEDVA